MEYVAERFTQRTLYISAARIDQDDLSRRRDDDERIDFEMKIEEILSPSGSLIVSGTRLNSEPVQWIRVEANLQAGTVTFDILD